VDVASGSAIIIAAENASISVHASKAAANSVAGTLSLAVQQRSGSASSPVYSHLVPGCNSTGRPFLSVVSVYNDTCISVQQYDDAGDPRRPRRLYTGTLQVRHQSSWVPHTPAVPHWGRGRGHSTHKMWLAPKFSQPPNCSYPKRLVSLSNL